NRFTVTRQLRYSRDETQRALDLVLFVNGLPGFELEGENRQAVHEEHQVQGPLRLVAAVAKLAGDGKAVLRIQRPGLRVSRRRRAVEKLDVVRSVLNPVAQYVHHAALAHLALKPRQKLAPCGTVVIQVKRVCNLRLRRTQKGRKLNEIDAILPVRSEEHTSELQSRENLVWRLLLEEK